MDQDPALQCREAAKVEDDQREPVIRHQDSMRRQHPLTVGAALHGSEDGLEVPPHTPATWSGGLSQPHRFENRQPFRGVPFHERRTPARSNAAGIFRHREEWGVRRLGPVGIALDHAVERSVAVLMHFVALSRCGIQLRPMAKLPRTEILRDFADALLDVVAADPKRPSFRADSSERHMHVRVLRVEVGHGHPFERRSKVALHTRDHLARQPFQVDPVAELGRHDHLP